MSYSTRRCLTNLSAMLKQIGKAILPESIKAFSTASAANRSLHSSCNFNTILRQTHFCARISRLRPARWRF